MGQAPISVPPGRRHVGAGDRRLDLLSTLLEEEGFRVLKAYNGDEVWSLASHDHPDLVVSDVTMPPLDGLGLLRRVRNAAGLHHTPVILMSAGRRTLATDRSTFVAKPFDIDRLLSVIETELAAS